MRRCSRRFHLGLHRLASKYGKDGNWTPRLGHRGCPGTCERAFKNRWRRALLPDRRFLFWRKRSARLHCLRWHFRRDRRRHSVGDRRTYGLVHQRLRELARRGLREAVRRRLAGSWLPPAAPRILAARYLPCPRRDSPLRYVPLWSEFFGRMGKLLWTRALVLRLDRLLEKLAPVNEMIAQRQLSRRKPDW